MHPKRGPKKGPGFLGPFLMPLNCHPVTCSLLSISESYVPLPRLPPSHTVVRSVHRRRRMHFAHACDLASERVTHFCTELRVGHECKDGGGRGDVGRKPHSRPFGTQMDGRTGSSRNTQESMSIRWTDGHSGGRSDAAEDGESHKMRLESSDAQQRRSCLYCCCCLGLEKFRVRTARGLRATVILSDHGGWKNEPHDSLVFRETRYGPNRPAADM